MIRRPPRSTRVRSSAASDVYKRQDHTEDPCSHKFPVVCHGGVVRQECDIDLHLASLQTLLTYAGFMPHCRPVLHRLLLTLAPVHPLSRSLVCLGIKLPCYSLLRTQGKHREGATPGLLRARSRESIDSWQHV